MSVLNPYAGYDLNKTENNLYLTSAPIHMKQQIKTKASPHKLELS